MIEQNQRLEEIKKRCKTSSKVIRVIQIIAIVGLIGSLVGTIWCFVMKETINTEIAKQVSNGVATIENFKIDGGMLKVAINYDEMFQRGDYATPLCINFGIATVITAITAYLLTLLKKVFDNLIKDNNPFSDSNMKYIKTSFIVMSVILLIFAGIGAGVICGLLCWCIYSILEYGRELQVEVDETL